MTKNFPGELWKRVVFDFEFTNDYALEVSNFGRLRAFNKQSDGDILKGSTINGYRIIRLKFFKHRNAQTEKSLAYLKDQTVVMQRHIKALRQTDPDSPKANEAEKLLESVKKNLSKKFKDDLKERTMNYHSLVHKLVADYFCTRPSKDCTVVAHIDFEKMNNRASNLKWMTPEENYAHQQHSPFVIAKKASGTYDRNPASKVNKLTITKVMLLKKLLNQGKPIRTLVKQFKVTDTQILRIKRGENWGDVQAAT